MPRADAAARALTVALLAGLVTLGALATPARAAPRLGFRPGFQFTIPAFAPLAVSRSPYTLAATNVIGDSTTAGVGNTGTGYGGAGNDYPNQLRGLVSSGTSSLSCAIGTAGTANFLCNNGIAAQTTTFVANAFKGLATTAAFTGWTSGTTLHVTSITSGSLVGGTVANASAGDQPIYVGGVLKAAINLVASTAGGDVATYTLWAAPTTAIGSSGSPVAFTAGAPAELSRNQIISGGINDNLYTLDWVTAAEANYATAVSYVTGGADYAFLLPWQLDLGSDGMQAGTTYRALARDMIATYGGRVIEFQRYSRDYWQGTSAGPDYHSVFVEGNLPISLRDTQATFDVPYNDAPAIIGSGGVVPTGAGYASAAIGQWYFTGTNAMWIKTGAAGADTWTKNDGKHLSNPGYALVAQAVADYSNAANGNGPPWVPSQEFLTPLDVASGATVGTLAIRGTPTALAITNQDGSAQSLFAVSTGGVVTRTSTGTLAEGVTSYFVWATNAKGTLRSPLDIYVGRASTDTTPHKFTVSSGMTIQARENHGFTNGSTISGAFLIKIDTLATAPYIVNFSKGSSTNSRFQVTVQSSGKMSFVAYNAANTLAINVSPTTPYIPAGTWTWVLFSFDVATPRAVVYLNDTNVSPSSAGFVSGTINFADTDPVFLAASAPLYYGSAVSPVIGGFGFGMVTPGYIDWSVAATRRQLFDTSFNPVARTPYSTIGGIAPFLEVGGGKGEILYGQSKSGSPQTLMIPSYRARTVMN